MNQAVKVAILDMYNGEPNQGMRCIIDIVNRFNQLVTFEIFDIRGKAHFPKIADFDIYISTGGPGNPQEGDGNWDVKYYQLIDDLWKWNAENQIKKHVLFICHSFQMACIHFGLGQVTKRKGTSFGVMTIHKENAGLYEPTFSGLDNPFYAIDSRDFQVVKPNMKKFRELGASIVALEKIRDHVQYERAIMGIRFSKEFIGFQFHPEADPISFLAHMKNREVREKIIAMKGRVKFLKMLEYLVQEETIYKTNETIIPNFLRSAINDSLKQRKILMN